MVIDKRNDNLPSGHAIVKEMTEMKVAFKILISGEEALIGYQYLKCHVVFDIQLEDSMRKPRLVVMANCLTFYNNDLLQV